MEQSHDNGSPEPKDAISTGSNECKDKEYKNEEYKWRLSNLLGSEQTDYLEYHSDSNSAESVCTEDFIVKFKQGMVEPIASNFGNEDLVVSKTNYGYENPTKDLEAESVGLTIPLCESNVGDNFPLSSAGREDILQQFKDELEEDLQAAFPTADEHNISVATMSRRDSIESLGGQISRLSQAYVSEPPSLIGLEKDNFKINHLPPQSAEIQQNTLGSCEEHSFEAQSDAYPQSTILKRSINRADTQETNTDLKATESARTKQSWASDASDQKFKFYSSEGQSHTIYDTTADFSKGQIEKRSFENNEIPNQIKANSSTSPKDLGSYAEIFEDGRRTKLGDSQSVAFPGHKTVDQSNDERSHQMVTSKIALNSKNDSTETTISYNTAGHPGRNNVQASNENSPQYTMSQSSLETQYPFNLKTEDQVDNLSKMNSSMKGESVSPYKHVAGIPLKSFDTVTVDSDLDSVTTERVRDHIRKALGSRRDPEHSTRRVSRNRKSSFRYPSSSKSPTDDEDDEDFEKPYTSTEWSRSPKRWSLSPHKAAEFTWDRSAKSSPSDFRQYTSEKAQYKRPPALEELTAERVVLEESVAKLQQDVAVEEEKLSQKKAQCREADQSCHDVLQQTKEAYQKLESLQDLLEKTQKDVVKMEFRMRESQMKTEDARGELVTLEYKRNEYMKELQDLELELDSIKQECSSAHNSQIASFQYEISSLTSEREDLKARIRHLEGSLTFMERQELERQLNCAKSELYSEQRATRAKIEKLQENLEESQNKLEEKMAECADFQERNNQLKFQLRELEKRKEIQIQNQAVEAAEQKEVLNQQVTDLTCQAREQSLRISSLEKIVSEKELELLKFRDVISSLKADKEAQALAAEAGKEEQNKRVLELQVQHQQDKEEHLTKLREELQCQKQKEIQQFAENMEQVKTKALQDQAESLRNEMGEVAKSLEAKDKEIGKLKETLKSQKDSMKKLVVELKQEAREMVHNTLIREQKKWENEKRDALQIQRHTMEEEKLRDMADLREALERERRTSMVYEKKCADLQNIIQEQEIHNRSLQREKQEALDDLRAAMKEEKQEELKRFQQEMAEERERDLERLKIRLQQLEEEQHVLRAEKNESIFREREALAQAERAERALAREISAACARIQSTPGRSGCLSPSRNRQGSPSRLSTSQALQMLHGVSEETNQFIHELQQEVEAQKRTALHVQREKERELQQQKEQLQLEKEKALDLLRERLIQEHIEEITNFQRDQLKESNSADSRSLRQQLREKDNELRAIQRNMAKWKDETAVKLACKFEEELNSELEKSLSRSKASDRNRYTEKVGSAAGRPSMHERREHSHLRSSSTPSLNGAGAQHDFGALKILRHLQGRVRELRSDSRMGHTGSMEDLTMLRTDLGSSYREKPPIQRPSICERTLSQIQGTMRK